MAPIFPCYRKPMQNPLSAPSAKSWLLLIPSRHFLLPTSKNRFGATEEVGIFEMDEKGLKEIDNPSALFLQDRVKNVSGSVVTVVMEGTRPMLVEIQALVVPSGLAMPRRVAN